MAHNSFNYHLAWANSRSRVTWAFHLLVHVTKTPRSTQSLKRPVPQDILNISYFTVLSSCVYLKNWVLCHTAPHYAAAAFCTHTKLVSLTSSKKNPQFNLRKIKWHQSATNETYVHGTTLFSLPFTLVTANFSDHVVLSQGVERSMTQTRRLMDFSIPGSVLGRL